MMSVSVIAKIVAEHFGVDTVHEHDELTVDFDADQIDIIELIMLIEEKFNISVSDFEIKHLRTVKDIIDCVSRKRNLNVC